MLNQVVSIMRKTLLALVSLAVVALTMPSTSLAGGGYRHGYDRHHHGDRRHGGQDRQHRRGYRHQRYGYYDYRNDYRYYGGYARHRPFYRQDYGHRGHYHRYRPIVRIYRNFDRYIHCPDHGGYFYRGDIYYR